MNKMKKGKIRERWTQSILGLIGNLIQDHTKKGGNGGGETTVDFFQENSSNGF